MTRPLFTALALAAATLAGAAQAIPAPSALIRSHDVAAATACAPVTVLERRGDWSRVTMGETFGWVLTAQIDSARCAVEPGIALDAAFRPREAATIAFA
ncbi:MAG: hypothetical protein KDK12_16020 [Rhodobacteraceae bacterium]|nr:hypothetical protein [Paracoccaceae bacterium]